MYAGNAIKVYGEDAAAASVAFKILDSRHYAANSIAYRMGYNPDTLSAADKNLIYKEIDIRTSDALGLEDLYEHKDLLDQQELTILKEKLECFEPQKNSEKHLTHIDETSKAQASAESTATASVEETEPIERKIENAESEISITANPPPFDPKGPKEKEDEKQDFENTLNQNKEYKDCKNKLNEIEKELSDLKAKDYENAYSNMKDIEKNELEASRTYEQIRQNHTDIDKIADNLKIDKNYVQQVKEYVFLKEHQLIGGKRRFDPNLNIAENWNRLINNKFLKSDLEWFLHEFSEYILSESHQHIDHNTIHSYAAGIHNWVGMLSK